ncbi:MAG: carbohydrate kinase [Pelagibacteraceae bacterium]|nr:carbohydrate kinase [Pelagibacteraceae bacterium]|tara:strand:- start:6763 stop:8031 length:1269 start_codon:yes stop_codon:yes gene_type:complete
MFLGIDFGTSGVRASVINKDKKEIYNCQVPIPLPLEKNNIISQDPYIWWNAFIELSNNLKKNFDIQSINKISVNGTSGTVLLTDFVGMPLSNAIMYNDTSSINEGKLVEKISDNHPIVSSSSNALVRALKIIKDKKKDIQSYKILHQADWIAGKIINEFIYSDDNNSLKLGYDCVNKKWPDWIAKLPINQESLPKILSPGTTLNFLQNKELLDLGFNKKTQVVAGTTDSIAAFLATGANKIGQAVTSIGSSLVVKYISKKPIFNKDYGIYSHKLGSKWLAGGASNVGGNILKHLFEDKIESLSRQVNPSKLTGMDYYPLFKTGERFPYNDPNKKAILEPRPDSEIIFFQAILEGISNVEKLCYSRLKEIGGDYPNEIFTVGGGSNNDNWNKIRSKILDIKLVTPLSTQASFGSALIAGGFIN